MKILKIAELGPDDYVANVKVDFSMQSNTDPSGAQIWDVEPFFTTTRIPYKINISSSDWGIDSVYPSLFGQVEIPFTVTRSLQDDEDVKDEKKVIVDLEQLKQEKVEGGAVCALGNMNLILDSNYQVDYENSNIEVIGRLNQKI